MIKISEKCIDPLSIKIDIGGTIKDLSVLFIWSDSKTDIFIHSDLITVTSGIRYESSINKKLSFFKNNINFKVICTKTYVVLYEYEFKHLNFLLGKNILYVSQNDHTGYGYSGRNYIHQLLNFGYNVQWNTQYLTNDHYKSINIHEDRVFTCLDQKLDCDTIIIHSTPDCWESIINKLPRNKKIYGLTTWETTRLHKDWVSYINNSVDEVIVPSEFNKHTFELSRINKKIHVWSHDIFPIDISKIDKVGIYNVLQHLILYTDKHYVVDPRLISDILKTKTVYYNISQYNERKNLNQVVNTFCTKFSKVDNVCLLIKTFFKKFTDSETACLQYKFHELLKQYENPPDIIFCFANLTDDQIQSIHYTSDVYFTLNRGEGFGLCTYTAKKFGNNIICGKFGAESEFLNNRDVLIDYKLSSIFNMDVYHNWYNDVNQQWAVYDDDVVISKLKYYPKVNKSSVEYLNGYQP